MGAVCRPLCNHKQNIKVASDFPLLSSFTPLEQSIHIQKEHGDLLSKIKERLAVIDPRGMSNLSWYQSTKFKVYLYGQIEGQRPIGDCLFYTVQHQGQQTPILVTTHIDQHYVFSEKTLIVNSDKTVYFGAIKNDISALPTADGKGLLFSPDFIYDGDFKNGVPHGFGHYRSKAQECVGHFKNGEPWGECIQKNCQELFIGTVVSDIQRTGFKITSKNKRIAVNQIKEQKDSQGSKIRSCSKDLESGQPLSKEATQPS